MTGQEKYDQQKEDLDKLLLYSFEEMEAAKTKQHKNSFISGFISGIFIALIIMNILIALIKEGYF